MSDIDATVCWVWLWWIFFFRVEQGELLQFLPKRDTLAQARFTESRPWFYFVGVTQATKFGGWATRSLAQVRLARLSEVARKPGQIERDFSPRREVLVLSDRCSRLGESSSLKRGCDEKCCSLCGILVQARVWVFLSEGMTRSCEKSSPKREDVLKPLFHTRSGEVG